MITHHTQLLQALIDKYELKRYCEIGVQSTAQNFDKIKCDFKVGVDPCLVKTSTQFVYTGKEKGFDTWQPSGCLVSMCSDDYFNIKSDTTTFDLIFIDGLHHAEQVKRDFENSLRCLSDNGFIVIHDVLPENEAGTRVPRETKQWWGDVYKWAMTIGSYAQKISFKTFNIDNGCMLVWKENPLLGLSSNYILEEVIRTESIKLNDWELYKLHGHTLMNVTSTVEI